MMISSLPKNVLIRTPTGLKELRCLKAGDLVIASNGETIDVDKIVEIKPISVEKNMIKIKSKTDEAVIGLTQHINGTEASNFKIGDLLKTFDVKFNIINTDLTAFKIVSYDDINFAVMTEKYHNLFVGNNGSILVECD